MPLQSPVHFGIVSPPVPGHIHPFGALGRELIARGHRVTLFHMKDVAEKARSEELDFAAIGQSDHPEGTLPHFHREITKRSGLSALQYTIAAVVRSTEMFCRDLPAAIQRAGVNALLVDQMEPAGACVAEMLGLPFVTVCNALALNSEPAVPPPFTPWRYSDSPLARLRNSAGEAVNRVVLRPVMETVARYRKTWNLPAKNRAEDYWSPVLQISQMAPLFDFPRMTLPAHFHYTGPLRRPQARAIDFPWERLQNSRPIVYSSLGTLQNGKEEVFRCFAEACEPLDVQLVITHGGGLAPDVSFPGTPLVVPYAPQLDVLARTSLTLTHAGLNTVLDSLRCGVPLIAIPITYEQPAIAARVKRSGSGLVLQRRRLKPELLRETIRQVLSEKKFGQSAKKIAASMETLGGVSRAAGLIEEKLMAT